MTKATIKRGLYIIWAILFSVTACNTPSPQQEDSPQTDEYPSSVEKKEGWWKEAIIYQIYPRSFKDSDGDGVGDLRGIIEKLDYIQSLGVDMVWLNPIYTSPNADNGYDISDYRGIMEEFGTMQDFDELLEGMHQRGIMLVMDLVVNHSSDEHPWFVESRKSRDNPYRDYYHWWPAEKGQPNPRFSFFDVNSDAWLYDSLSNAYFLHYFARKQPDLNWENPKVRQEVMDIMRFWLDKGIDGFRMDAFQYVSKDTTFPKLPEGYEEDIIKYYGMGPNLHPYLQEVNREVISQYDVMTVAEGAGSTFQDAHDLVDDDRNELNMVYHFEGMDIGNTLEGYKLADFKEVYSRWDSAFAKSGWLSIFLANHDVPRMVSKYGNDSPEFREVSAKMLNTFILSMRGTPYCYQGDELGMTNVRYENIEDYNDIAAKNGYERIKQEGGDLDAYMEELKALSRDNCRTPFQWDDSEYAGFSTAQPWLSVNPNYTEINAATADKDPNSVLHYFRKMTALRKANPVLVYGAYELLDKDNPQVYAYTRVQGEDKMVVLLNFSEKEAAFALPETMELGEVQINNYEDLKQGEGLVNLQPYQAVIYKFSEKAGS